MTRGLCPESIKIDVLRAQRFRCLYCLLPFGTVLAAPGGRCVVTDVAWDHRVPYAFLQSNPTWNWAAACTPCNASKSDLHFTFVDEVRDHVEAAWARRGLSVDWIPAMSSEQDPERWAADFSARLAGKGYKRPIHRRPFIGAGAVRQVKHETPAAPSRDLGLGEWMPARTFAAHHGLDASRLALRRLRQTAHALSTEYVGLPLRPTVERPVHEWPVWLWAEAARALQRRPGEVHTHASARQTILELTS